MAAVENPVLILAAATEVTAGEIAAEPAEIADELGEQGIWLCGGNQLPAQLMSALCGKSAWAQASIGSNDRRATGRDGRCDGRCDAAAAGCGGGVPGSAETGFGQGGVLDGLEPGPELAIFLPSAAACAADSAADTAGDRNRDGAPGGRSHGLVRGGGGRAARDTAYRGLDIGTGMRQLGDEALTGVLRGWRRLGSWAAAMEHAAAAELAERRIAAAESAGAWANEAERYASAEVAAALRLTRSAAGSLVGRALVLRGLTGTAAALAAGRIDMPRALIMTTGVAGLADDLTRAVEAGVLEKAPLLTTAELRRAVARAVMAADPAAADLRREQAQKQARVERWAEPAGTGTIAGRDLPPAGVIAADNRINALAAALKSDGAAGGMDLLRAQVFLDLLLGRPAAAQAPGAPESCAEPEPEPVPKAAAVSAPENCAKRSGWTGMTGSVNLTVPLASLIGLTGAPGEVAGFGPVTANTARDLAAAAAASQATRWCITVVGEFGQAVAHGCATRRRVRLDPGRDDQGRAGRGITVQVRDGPEHDRRHRSKRAGGWHGRGVLTQPEPGTLVWSAPSGWEYTVFPDAHPT